MTISTAPTPGLALRQALAVLAFVGALAAFSVMTAWFVGDLLERSAAVATLRERLAQIESHTQRGPAAGPGDSRAMGLPFLDGPTITVASAALQHRVDAAVAKVGGAVLSSQVELEGPQANIGFVSLTEYIEIGQPALQPLLYDIEAGMPYLFIDTLGVQTPQGLENAENARMIVVMGVTGQWQPAR
jgi:general secretion pathway protein M